MGVGRGGNPPCGGRKGEKPPPMGEGRGRNPPYGAGRGGNPLYGGRKGGETHPIGVGGFQSAGSCSLDWVGGPWGGVGGFL